MKGVGNSQSNGQIGPDDCPLLRPLIRRGKAVARFQTLFFFHRKRRKIQWEAFKQRREGDEREKREGEERRERQGTEEVDDDKFLFLFLYFTLLFFFFSFLFSFYLSPFSFSLSLFSFSFYLPFFRFSPFLIFPSYLPVEETWKGNRERNEKIGKENEGRRRRKK